MCTGYERVYTGKPSESTMQSYNAEETKSGKCKDVLVREKGHNRYHEFQTYCGIRHGERRGDK